MRFVVIATEHPKPTSLNLWLYESRYGKSFCDLECEESLVMASLDLRRRATQTQWNIDLDYLRILPSWDLDFGG